MALENEKEIEVDTGSAEIERDGSREGRDDRSKERDIHPRDRGAGKEKGKDLRSIVKAAVEVHKGKSYDEDTGEEIEKPAKSAPEKSPRDDEGKKPVSAKVDATAKAAPAADKTIPATEKVGNAPAPAVESVAVAPPDAVSKEIKAIWTTIPDPVKAEFHRLEMASRKGVEHLHQRVKAYDDTVAPLRDELRSIGKSELDGVRMLIDWRNALRGPQKAQALMTLARAEGIDLHSLIGSQQPMNAQNDYAPQQQPYFDPNTLHQYVAPVMQKVTSLEGEIERQKAERVNADIASMAADKPHFEQVRAHMGHLMNAGLVIGSNPKEAFDNAYEQACRAHPEVYAAIMQEQEAKRQADAQAAAEAAAKEAAEANAERIRQQREQVEKARKASIGPRAGSPSGMAINAGKRGVSVRDSVVNAIKSAGAAI